MDLIRCFRLTLALAGATLVATALTAGLTGIDMGGGWGAARRQVFGAGILLLAIGAAPLLQALLVSASKHVRDLLGRLGDLLAETPIAGPPARGLVAFVRRCGDSALSFGRALAAISGRIVFVRYATTTPERRGVLAAGMIFALAVAVSVWYVSVGYWTEWPGTTDYYGQLADAFRHGQLHLLMRPDPALLGLPDPYDFHERMGMAAPWDVVFYHGRFYLYWGPVPALMLTASNAIVPLKIGDNALTLVFVLSTILFLLLLLLELWRTYFKRLVVWAILPPLLVAAFAYPLPALLSGPAIYEASIAAGQCFLMAGLYWAATAILRADGHRWRLVVAGACWACAVGSKASLALPTMFWAGTLTLNIVRRKPAKQGRALEATALILPILLGMACLGWYNFERFGSPFEFGVRYQLTEQNLDRNFTEAFSLRNIPINLYNYLLNPVRCLAVFPFIKPRWSSTSFPLLAWVGYRFPGIGINPTEIYLRSRVAGVLYAFPYCAFALVAWLVALRRQSSVAQPKTMMISTRQPGVPAPSIPALVAALSGGALLGFGTSLIFGSSAMRHMAEVTPTLVILSTLGAWEWLEARKREGHAVRWVLGLMWAAALTSVAMSLLLAITGSDMRFEKLNPELFDRIVRFLAW